ncbi:MAG: twin-arginine translocase TatA/TatE family subunit [Bdellovibrionota bacterium]
MWGMSLSHILILVVVILLFGARRLPELGSALGRGIRAFKKGLDGEENPSPKQIADNEDDPSKKS